MTSRLESGREAARRREWVDAWESLSAADSDAELDPADLVVLADAAWWSGKTEDAIDALERAFSGYRDAGSRVDAAGVAGMLAYIALRRLNQSVGQRWHAEARSLLEGEPESEVLAYVEIIGAAQAYYGGHDLDGTLAHADAALAIARRVGSRDAESEALSFKGSALIASGDWQEGLALLDRATGIALSGGLALRTASDVYCKMISACRSVGDFGRAAEWTEEADRWMDRHSVSGYPGVCRVHRAELMRLRGNLSAAEEEAAGACVELERFRILDGVGMAHHQVGEVRLQLGDLEGAEQSFLRAYEYGNDAQPGYALLQLARGETDAAANALAKSLSLLSNGERIDLLGRAQLLPAQVTVALARDDLATARNATAELESIAADYGRPAFQAAAATARGELSLAEGDAGAAVEVLDRAWRQWRDIEFSYESAKARVGLGMARAALGDEASARLDLAAARATFELLGARLDLRVVDDLLYRHRPASNRERTLGVLMFTDIVTSTDLVEVIGDPAWEELLAWHDRELRSVFASYGGFEANHTGDGFFVVFDGSAAAVEAAIAIQRRLSEHRREQGFSPTVRIGVHRAEVTRDQGSFRGQGVHAAARIGAEAMGDEILISDEALADLGVADQRVSGARTVTLKGIKEPVTVHTVAWR